MKARIASKVLLAGWLVAMTAQAQSQDRAAADALFRAARDDFDRGAYVQACLKFAESHRLDPAPGTLLNLSLCYEKIGKVASAWEGYRQVAEKLRDERVGFATARSSALEQRLPWLTLRLPAGAPKGTRVFRDGGELLEPSLGIALPVDPGKHEIVVKAEGYEDATSVLELGEGARRDVVVRVGAKASAPASARSSAALPPRARPEATESPVRTLAWVLGAVGVAGVGTSLFTGARAMSDKSVVRDHCVDKRCDAEGLDAASSGRTMATVSTVAGAVGVTGLAVGTYLLLSGNREAAPATRVDVAFLPDGGAVAWTGRF